MSEDAHDCAKCGALTSEHICGSCQMPPPVAKPLLCPALTFSAWQTAHLHLCLAYAKVDQARELLALTGEAGRLCAQLENVASWLDDTAIRVTGQAVEAARL